MNFRKLSVAGCALATATLAAAPLGALARTHHHYDRYDQNRRYERHYDGCYAKRRRHGNVGTVVGGVAGGVVGNSVSHGSFLGTVVGAGAGAVVGHQIGKHSTRC